MSRPVFCRFCKGTGRPPRQPIRHSDGCPFSDYLRGCRLCSALQGSEHKPGCPYLSGDTEKINAAIDRTMVELRKVRRGPSV